jgi:hypothetical protein
MSNPGVAWNVEGSGYFNGVGRDDILWRNDSGLTSDWLGQADGGFVPNNSSFALNPGSAWHVAQIGDFNGDKIDDILWRNGNGLTSEWLGQSSGLIDNSANFLANPGTSWHIQDASVHDLFGTI